MGPRVESIEIKVGVLGASGVGKTALINMIFFNVFIEGYDPTYDQYRKQVLVDEQSYIVELLDAQSDEKVSPSHQEWRQFLIKQSDAILLVYDISSYSSFTSALLAHRQVMQARSQAELGEIPTHLVGNKRDLEHDRLVGPQGDMAAAKELSCGFAEVSAKTSENVERMFEDVVRSVISSTHQHKSDQAVDRPVVKRKNRYHLVKWVMLGFLGKLRFWKPRD